MADPRYPGDRVGVGDAVARMDATNRQIAEEEARRKRRLGEGESEARRETETNAKARRATTDVATSQAEAITSVREALTLETAKLRENTAAWEASAAARAAATGVARSEAARVASGAPVVYPSSSVSVASATERLGSTTSELESRLAAQAQARAAAERAQGAAKRYLEGLGIAATPVVERAPTPTERALASLRDDPVAAQNQAATRIARIAEGLNARPPVPTDTGVRYGPAGPPTFLPSDTGARVSALSEEEAKLVEHNRALQTAIGGTAAAQRGANAAFRESVAEVSASSQALTRHGALSTEFIQSFVRGEVTLQQFGSSLVSTIGKFGGWAVAGGLVYGAFNALKRAAEGAKETASGVDQLERAIPTGVNRKEAEEGFRNASAAINVPIKDVANAQFFAARAGFHGQKESLQAGEIGLEALKLDEVPVQDATKALGAVRQAFGLTMDELKKTFHELNQGQLEFNARLSQTLPQLGRAASAYANAGGKVTGLTRELVSVVGITGGGGGTGGGNPSTFFVREPSNIERPQAISGLRALGFDPIKGQKNIEALNQEVRQRYAEGKLNDDQVRAAAKLLGGGGAQGGRYGIANIVSGGGRAQEIEKELARQPAAGRAEDLGRKLDQLDEKFHALGTSAERLGSLVGKTGVTFAIEEILSLLKSVGSAFEFIAGPLNTLGSALNDFSKIPVVPQALAALGIGKAASAFSRSETGQGLRGPLGEVKGLGALSSESDRQLVGLRATVSRALEENRDELHGANVDYKRGRRLEKQAFDRQAAFLNDPNNANAKASFERATLADQIPSEEAQQFAKQAAANQALVQATQARVKASYENAVALQQENIVLRQELELYRGPGTSQAKVQAAAAQYGAVEGRTGTKEPLVGPAGYTGAQREAERRAFTGTEESATAAEAAARDMAVSGAALGASIQATDDALASGALSTRDAFRSAYAEIREGAAEVGSSLKELVAAIREGGVGAIPGAFGQAGRGAAGGLATGGGGLLAGLGAATSKIGSNLLGGFFKAYIGSAIAEVVGENIVGGKTGQRLASVGGDAAIGAGIGSIVAPEFGGTFIGAGLGGLYGLLTGSGTGEDTKSAEKRLQLARRRNREATERIAKGIGAGEGGKDLEYAASAYAETLNEAFADESDKAKRALSAIQKENKAITANLKLFGQQTPEGRNVQSSLQTNLTGSIVDYLKNSKDRPEAASLIEQAIQTSTGVTVEDFNRQIKVARPRDIPKLLRKAEGVNQNLYESIGPHTDQQLHNELKGYETQEKNLTAELAKAPRGTDQSRALRKKLNDAEAAAANIKNGIKVLAEIGPKLFAEINEINRTQLAEAGYKAAVEKASGGDARRLAEAGADPAAKRRVERDIRRRNEGLAGKVYGNKPGDKQAAENTRNEAVVNRIEEGHNEAREQSEAIDRRAAREIAHLPASASKGAIDAIKQRAAGEKAAFEAIHKGAFSPREIEEASNAQAEAGKAAQEAGEGEAKALAIALDAGNAQAQAADAARFAKTRLESVEAGNQGQQALEQHIAATGALAESRTPDVLARDRIKLHTLRSQLRSAKPDEAVTIQAAINDEVRKYSEDKIGEAESHIKFLEHTERISSTQGLQKLKNLLKFTKGLSRQRIEQLKSAIFDAENEGTNNQLYNLAPGSIKLPTAFDVQRAIHGRGSAGVASQLIHAPVSNVNHINVEVTHASDLPKVVAIIEQATSAGVRSRLRARGLRGN